MPPEWLDDVRAANEDTVLELADHLPGEAAEALLELATGGTPQVAPVAVPSADPFDHPDAQRRFRVMSDVEELERALEYPWEKWTVFLHPEQRHIVDWRLQRPGAGLRFCRDRAKPSWPCTAPFIWQKPIRIAGCC